MEVKKAKTGGRPGRGQQKKRKRKRRRNVRLLPRSPKKRNKQTNFLTRNYTLTHLTIVGAWTHSELEAFEHFVLRYKEAVDILQSVSMRLTLLEELSG